MAVGAAALIVAGAGSVAAAGHAAAEACPDVQVVFARGTFEPAGVGGVGQAFVDALRAKAPGKSVDAYAVNYPASLDFATAADGVIDARNKVMATANACPNTKVVLGGYSLLAVVEDDDVGVIGVDDDALMRTPRSTVASGAFVISVTGSSSR
ncbi:hypothetical protein MPHO_51780 [Mycolicibacterium phocaicum]|nr:hypothetical protein MPHO_51780 [Mycolicibacterium phocaicum]